MLVWPVYETYHHVVYYIYFSIIDLSSQMAGFQHDTICILKNINLKDFSTSLMTLVSKSWKPKTTQHTTIVFSILL